MYCAALASPNHGRLNSTYVGHGTVVNASCDPGFMFPDENLAKVLVCVDDGQPLCMSANSPNGQQLNETNCQPTATDQDYLIWSDIIEDCQGMVEWFPFCINN